MAQLFSRYASGLQFTAGTMTGSVLGTSGLNVIVDRLNSITSNDGAYSNLSSGAGISIANGSVIDVVDSQVNPTSLGSGCVALDHGTGTTDMVVNVCYGTSSTPPSAATVTEGTLYIDY